MSATTDASGGSSSQAARRASTSFSVPRMSIDFSLSTTSSTTPPTATTPSSSNSNLAKSLPSRCSPPPSYLLDDDPFANLNPMTVGTRHRSNSSVASTSSCIPRSQRPPPIHPEWVPGLSLPAVPAGLPAPKSRLQESLEAGAASHEGDTVRRARSQNGQKEANGKEQTKRKRAKTFFVTMSEPVSPSLSAPNVPVPPLPTNPESISLPTSPKLPSLPAVPPPSTRSFLASSRLQPRPAHQRPAFAARPSLPSLDTLAKTNIVLTNKVRKGHVGAGLPFEPWDNLPEDDQQPCTAPYMPAIPTMPSVPAKPLVNSEDIGVISHVDRTPCTPISGVPSSPPKISSPSTSASFSTSPPQPLLSQTVALGPLAEDVEVKPARPLLWSPRPEPSTFGSDAAVLRSVSSSPNLSNNFVESHSLAAPIALLPSVPESSMPKAVEAEAEILRHSSADSDRNSVEAPDEENGYFTGDLLDAYGISDTPEPEPEIHDSQRWTNKLDNDPEALANKEPNLRWSVDASDRNAESQEHSPSSSNSYTGSVSDLSSAPSYPSYSFYGYRWSNSDRDSIPPLSLSRPISSTSISSSIGDDIESNMNLSHFHSQSDSQETDVSQSLCDHPLSSRSTLISSDSGKNSILHSPDSDWTFLAEQQLQSSHLPDILVGPALQKRGVLPSDDSAAAQQVAQDSPPETPPSSLDNLRSQRNGHAVTHDKLQATADDLLSTSSDPSPPPNHNFDPFLQPTEDYRFSFLEGWAPPIFSALPSDQRSSLGSTAGEQPPSVETIPSKPPSSTLDLLEALHPETHLQEMTGIDMRLREKMTYSGERDHHRHHLKRPSAVSSDFGTVSPKLGSKSGEEEEQRRRMFLQMRRDHSLQSSIRAGEDDSPIMHRSVKSADGVSTLHAASALRSISRTTSGLTSSSNPQQFPSALSPYSTSDEEEQLSVSSDDDIPLAQRIPGALAAQQSIRKQVNQERAARRAEREARRRERQVTLRPARAGPGGVEPSSKALSNSPGAPLHAATSAPNPTASSTLTGTLSPLRQPSGSVHKRQKSQGVPIVHSSPRVDQAFKPEDLARKLQNVKLMSETSSPAATPNMRFQQPFQLQGQANKLSRSVSGNSRHPQDVTFGTSPISPPPGLKPKRSFHAPDIDRRSRDAVSSRPQLPLHKRSMSVGRADREGTARRGHEIHVPPLPDLALQRQTSLGDRGRRIVGKPHSDSKVAAPYDLERLQHSVQDTTLGSAEGVVTSRHRIFIHSPQHPRMVDIRTDTGASDLIASLEAEGVLDGWAGLGGWTIWEIAQDFGMERPVRSYELLSDIQASWLKDKTVNYFLLKKSSLSLRLDQSAIPSSAPSHSGWVEWEAKRGKWSKRWLHLKENSLYISKKDGRDETLLCSLSNFDAYFFTRSHRAPKPFAFTVKSTDNLSFFENTADYMHTFSCSEQNGEAWMEKIFAARSYVLRQERSALFHLKSPNLDAAISRSGTKKTNATKSHQPLVDLSPGDIFVPGSLLSG